MSATPSAAWTLHNDRERIEQLGVVVRDDTLTGAVEVETKDVDLKALAAALAGC